MNGNQKVSRRPTMNQSNTPRIPPRRLVLMASAAGVALAVVLGGPSLRQAPFSAFANPVQAAETTLQHPADFSDLIARVKPAVISVRVKMTEDSSDQSSDNNSQMQKFFQQF